MPEDFPVVFALYPGVTQLDFTGPLEVFLRLPGARIVLAASVGGELALPGLTLSGIVPLAEVHECALLCVPGGFGTDQAMRDSVYLGALRRLAARARYVTSVCTGSLLLGAAGLLQGRRAACHWAFRELLPQFGAHAEAARVVRDGSLITGGGVTAGIDMALAVMAEIAGRDFAEAVQLALEYAPEPPFGSGRPELAREPVLTAVHERLAAHWPSRRAAVAQAAARLTATRP